MSFVDIAYNFPYVMIDFLKDIFYLKIEKETFLKNDRPFYIGLLFVVISLIMMIWEEIEKGNSNTEPKIYNYYYTAGGDATPSRLFKKEQIPKGNFL